MIRLPKWIMSQQFICSEHVHSAVSTATVCRSTGFALARVNGAPVPFPAKCLSPFAEMLRSLARSSIDGLTHVLRVNELATFGAFVRSFERNSSHGLAVECRVSFQRNERRQKCDSSIYIPAALSSRAACTAWPSVLPCLRRCLLCCRRLVAMCVSLLA